MRLAFPALLDAVEAHLSADLAAALPEAAIALGDLLAPPLEVDDLWCGDLLLRAAGVVAPEPVRLSRVDLQAAGENFILTPEEAALHPLLGVTPSTLQYAIGAPIVSAARGEFLAVTSPIIDQVDAVDGAAIVGSCRFRLSAATGLVDVLALYGPLSASAPYAVTRTFRGRELYEIGRAARIASQATTVRREPLPICAEGGADLASATLH